MNRIWIVQRKLYKYEWHPLNNFYFTRKEARRVKKDCYTKASYIKYRIRKYEQV